MPLFDFSFGNIVPALMLVSLFIAFAEDKFKSPEFFCWPGAWMAGSVVELRSPRFTSAIQLRSSTRQMTTVSSLASTPIAIKTMSKRRLMLSTPAS